MNARQSRSQSSSEQAFHLNIEEVLEHWTLAFAIRELIANALDEQVLTRTSEPQIFKDNQQRWHIADSGRGLHAVPTVAELGLRGVWLPGPRVPELIDERLVLRGPWLKSLVSMLGDLGVTGPRSSRWDGRELDWIPP
jgi:hypothetical protein